MRRITVSLIAASVMAVLLVVAAPAAHADPTPPPAPPAPTGAALNCPDIIQGLCNAAVAAAPIAGAAVANSVPAVGGAAAVATNAAQVVDFVKDPLGFVSAAVMGAATWMLSQVSALANASTAPDLSASWWIDAYQKGMAVGIVLLCFVLLYETFMLARRRITPDDWMATMSLYAPATLGAMLFGPAVFQFLIQGATQLADGIIRSLTGFGGSDSFNQIDKSIQNTSVWATGATGAAQAFLALFFGLLMLIAAVLVYLSLCMQAIVIYLGTALFAVGVVWFASTRHREHAWSIPRMVITVAFSKCVLFFCLGVCLAIATAATSLQGNGVSGDLALIVMATIGMFIAAFTPLILLKHAPILPGMGAGVGVGAGVAGSAAGWTVGSAAARGAGRMVRGGGSKLGAASSRKGAPTPPPGAPPSGAHRIDGPVPTPASKTASARRGSSASGTATTSSPTPGRKGGGSAAQAASAAALAPGRTIDQPIPPAASTNGARKPAGRQPDSQSQGGRSDAWKTHKDQPVRHPAGRQPGEPGAAKLPQASRKPTTPPTGDKS